MIEKNTFVKNIGSFADENRLEPRGTNFRRRKLDDKRSIYQEKSSEHRHLTNQSLKFSFISDAKKNLGSSRK
jgi:hypothetical protein